MFKLLILGLFLLMQFWLLFLKKHDTLDINSTPGTNPTIVIWGDRRLAQSFVSRKNGLARIDIVLATHFRRNTKNVFFELREAAPGGKIVVRQAFNASSVRNGAYRTFTFPSQQNSAGKKYVFSFFSPESTEADSICLWMNRRNIYDDGNFLINGKRQEEDLDFRVYSRRTIMAELPRIVRNYPGVFHSPVLLAATILLFTLAEILVLTRLIDVIYALMKGERAGVSPP